MQLEEDIMSYNAHLVRNEVMRSKMPFGAPGASVGFTSMM